MPVFSPLVSALQVTCNLPRSGVLYSKSCILLLLMRTLRAVEMLLTSPLALMLAVRPDSFLAMF